MEVNVAPNDLGHTKENRPLKANVKWYQIEPKQLEVRLNTDFTKGLTEQRVVELQKRYGKNIFSEDNSSGIFSRALKQFTSPLVLILLIAGLVTLFLGVYLDSAVIFIALFINIIIGLVQEGRASRAFDKLSKSQEKYATVVRGGERKVVSAEDVVVGDIVVLEAGMNVPADVRILEETDLTINEAPLTGEWVSVDKEVKTFEKKLAISEQENMAWMGTLVSSGFAKGAVVEIGSSTQLGDIAEELVKKDVVKTPIQKSIRRLAVFLSYVIIGSVVLIFALGMFRGESLFDMLLVAIAIAVSVVPEGLPAAVTVVLAIGMEKILKKGGLVKNMLAAETLGSTTVIITDKTGTLTQGRMKLEEAISLEILRNDCADENTKKCSTDLLRMAVLSSDAFTEPGETEEQGIVVHGRPIEKAIVTEGLERGLSQDALFDEHKRIDFLSFSSENRFAASLNMEPGKKSNRLYFSGSPEHILNLSSHVLHNGEEKQLTEEDRKLFTDIQKNKSEQGMRLTAVAYKDIKGVVIKRGKDGKLSKELMTDIVFVGVLTFADPIRPDVKKSIKTAKTAGAMVIMATGDNPGTAKSIAIQAGIDRRNSVPVLGLEFENLSDEELLKKIIKTKVFARVLPSQKLRMVNVLRNAGYVVAMTGDGINDAPALRSADIGIAVGSGTDVAKEASDLVLLDNSFSIIVSSIEEGRRIIDNLKRIISHLVSTSFGEIFLIAGALLFAIPLPILPAQILWVNIVEGGLLNFAFAFEPPEDGIMKRKPSHAGSSGLITPNIKKLIFVIGTITGIFTLSLYVFLRNLGLPIDELRTVMFVTLSFDSIFFILSMKSFDRPIWKINILNNKFLLLSVFISIATLFLAMIFGPLRNLLQLTTLHVLDVVILIGVAIFNLLTIELAKYFIFWRNREVLVN